MWGFTPPKTSTPPTSTLTCAEKNLQCVFTSLQCKNCKCTRKSTPRPKKRSTDEYESPAPAAASNKEPSSEEKGPPQTPCKICRERGCTDIDCWDTRFYSDSDDSPCKTPVCDKCMGRECDNCRSLFNSDAMSTPSVLGSEQKPADGEEAADQVSLEHEFSFTDGGGDVFDSPIKEDDVCDSNSVDNTANSSDKTPSNLTLAFSSDNTATTTPNGNLGNLLYCNDELEFYSSVQLQPRQDAFVDHHVATNDKWCVRVGDFVCIQVSNVKNDINPPIAVASSTPFAVPWRPGQVLSVFRDKSSECKTSLSPLKVEVRWFYRMSDLDSRNLEFEKSQGSSDEEIFESEHVAVVDAVSLLGVLVLMRSSGGRYENESQPVVPCAKSICCRFYLHEEKDILHLFDEGGTVTRGLECSGHLQQYGELKRRTYKYLGLPFPKTEGDGNCKDQNMLNLPPHSLLVKDDSGLKALHSSCILTYPWSALYRRNLICPLELRGSYPKWTLVVGDIIAVPRTSSQPPCGVDDVDGRHNWYPYCQPWSHAQVVAIYKEDINKSDSPDEPELASDFASEVKLRVRWLDRISEAFSEAEETEDGEKIARLLEIAGDYSRNAEALVEGAMQATEISADMILGPVRLDGDHETGSPVSLYMVQNRRVLEHPRENSIRSGLDSCGLFASGQQIDIYHDNILKVRKKRLLEGMLSCVHSDSAPKSNDVKSSSVEKKLDARNAKPPTTGTDENVCPPPTRPPNSPSAGTSAPRRSPRLSREQSLFTPRRSPRLSEKRSASDDLSTPGLQKRRLFESPQRSPLRCTPKKEPTQTELRTAVDSIFSPFFKDLKTVKELNREVANHFGMKRLTSEMKALVRCRVQERVDMKDMKIDKCQPTTTSSKKRKKTGNNQGERTMKKSPGQKSKKSMVNDLVQAPRVICRKRPFHVDVSSMKSFYNEIEIEPPVDAYEGFIVRKIKSSQRKKPWVVKMGDTVTLEIEADSKAGSCYPFNVAWSPVEIVSIFRVHGSKESCKKLRESIEEDSSNGTFEVDVNENKNDIQLEVRWLYRMNEIAGSRKSASPNLSSLDRLDEVLETDHLDYCSADSILSPVVLYENDQLGEEMGDIVDGLPCIHYHCSRFWSVHRKSFITNGSLLGRVMRGRMYSDIFGKHGTASAALKRLESHIGDNELSVEGRDLSWQEAFRTAIGALSLAEAAQDVQLRGTRLPCRDQERNELMSFLRTAICGRTLSVNGVETSMAVKSSMFIAGPPGTGKTASLRSVIRELQEKQSSGEVPEFKYIEINGMEQKSPFDAYVEFWEALSGIKKEALPAGQAAARLDRYFTDQASDYGEYEGETTRRPVTVLLLDEIDYLVTEKETVLYSFFDWPLRAVPSAKLIVIGIANTLNLPDRLSQRMSSRIGQTRMFFPAYNTDEIVTIIKERLGMEGDTHHPTRDIFEIDAIRFAARKTANRSGDIRKAFNICKIAAERVYEANLDRLKPGDDRPTVRLQDVIKTCNDMFSSIISRAIACSTSYQACLLIAIGSLMKAGMEEARFQVQDIRTKMVSIADASGDDRYEGVARLDNSATLHMITRLAESGILHLTYSDEANNPFPLVGTHLNTYEILQAFQGTDHSKLANKHVTVVMGF